MMYEGYVCAWCKKPFQGKPAVASRAGNRCEECERMRKEKTALTIQARKRNASGVRLCFLCQLPVKEGVDQSREGENLHACCLSLKEKFRREMEKSPGWAAWVSKAEPRAALVRERRLKAQLRSTAVAPLLSQISPDDMKALAAMVADNLRAAGFKENAS